MPPRRPRPIDPLDPPIMGSLTLSIMNSTTLAAPALRLRIEGMTCASCVARVEKALKQVPGVASADVNLATERAEVRVSDRGDAAAALVAAVEKAGYHASVEHGEAPPAAAAPRDGWRVAVAAA